MRDEVGELRRRELRQARISDLRTQRDEGNDWTDELAEELDRLANRERSEPPMAVLEKIGSNAGSFPGSSDREYARQADTPPVRLLVEWEETSRFQAELSLDEIRDLLGLNGTADADVARRMWALSEFQNGGQLERLAEVSEMVSTSQYKLLNIGTREVTVARGCTLCRNIGHGPDVPCTP